MLFLETSNGMRKKPPQTSEKYRISFEEAASVFSDLNYVLVADSTSPDRYVALGYSSLARLVVVVHCERAERLRIISARRATNLESKEKGTA